MVIVQGARYTALQAMELWHRRMVYRWGHFFSTEFLHGLYDGGHGAGLEDYRKIMWDHPLSAGGFLWVLSDEVVVRTDMDGWIDTDGDHASDGILGPYREKEGSYP